MAPTPVEETPPAASSTIPEPQYWTKPTIAVTAVFAALALAIVAVLLVFLFKKRADKKNRENRKSDHHALLAYNEDKTSMFTKRDGHSSVALYVDHQHDANTKQHSQETVSVVPLHMTPFKDSHDPMAYTSRPDPINTTVSNGSGVSALSRLSNTTRSTLMLSPITTSAEEGDLSIRPSERPRSTSSSSLPRYYETTPQNVSMPPLPTIISTTSD